MKPSDLAGLPTAIARDDGLLNKRVWCTECGKTQVVENGLAHGWPKCCGYTMTIDSPEKYPERHRWRWEE